MPNVRTVGALLVLLAIGGTCLAQQEIFRVIACSEGVKIGSETVTGGMRVGYSKERLTIPSGGYLIAINNEGYVGKLTKGLKVTSVPGAIARKSDDRINRFQATGAVHRDGSELLYCPMAPRTNQNADMLGDSLFLYWAAGTYWHGPDAGKPHVAPTGEGYSFAFTNMFDEKLLEIETNKNWLLIDLSDFRTKEAAAVYNVTPKEGGRGQDGLIKFLSGQQMEEARNNYARDVGAIVSDPDRLFFECAILEAHKFYYDKHLPAYKIISQRKQPSDPFLKKYFDRMARKYGFDIIQMD